MTVLYTHKQIQDILRDLRIKPKNGMVTTREAARILTWRAREEYCIEHEYPEAAVRRHVDQGNLKIAGKANKVSNLFRVEDVFELGIAPKRGIAQRKRHEETEPRLKAVKRDEAL
jgi:hypothetical protein